MLILIRMGWGVEMVGASVVLVWRSGPGTTTLYQDATGERAEGLADGCRITGSWVLFLGNVRLEGRKQERTRGECLGRVFGFHKATVGS